MSRPSAANAPRRVPEFSELSAAPVSPLQQDEINKAMEEIENTPNVDEVVAVVKLHVVDRAEGLVLVQQVLAESQIPVDEGQSEENTRTGPRFAAKPASAGTAGQEALYVIAEPEQLVAAFATILAREKIASALEVADPIEVAALDENSKKRLRQVDRELISNDVGDKDADDAKSSADGKPASLSNKEADKNSLAGKVTGDAQTKSSTKAGESIRAPQRATEAKQNASKRLGAAAQEPALADSEAVPAPGAQARQMVVNLPVRAVNERGRVRGGVKDSTPANSAGANGLAASSQKKEQPLRDEKADADDRAPALVRVLIVVEESAK